MQTKMILLIIFVFFVLSVVNYVYSTKTYNVKSVLQVESARSYPNGDVANFLLSGDDDSSNLQNQMFLLKKRSNLQKLIQLVSLNAKLQDENDEKDIEIKQFTMANEPETSIVFDLVFDDNGNVSVIEDKNIIINSIPLNESYQGADFSIHINSNKKNYSAKLIYIPTDKLITAYNQFIRTSSMSGSSAFNMRNGGLISVDYITSNPEKGIEILNTLNQIYLEEIVFEKSQKARKAIDFIDGQLETLKSVLETNKIILSQFLEKNSSVNVDLETESLLRTLTDVQAQIAEINLEEAEIQGIYTETSPLYQQLRSRRQVLDDQVVVLESKVKDLPTAQQKYISLAKEVEISQTLYSELLNRKLNYSIAEASTLGNIKVIDHAYVERKVSPQLGTVFLINLFGIFIASIIALIRGIYFTPITNPAEIADKKLSSSPLVGILPFADDETKKDFLTQSLESLLVNIKNSQKEGKKIILFTSSTPGNGKSFTSHNFSEHLGHLGYKVLLVDADQKRGALHKNYKKQKISQADFNDLASDTNFMKKYKINDKKYFVPRISRLIDSFQLFDSGVFSKFLELYKPEFDFIIIDTPPFLSVAETSLILGLSDLKYLVVRHELSKPNELKQSEANISQLGLNFDGLIYNAFEKPSGYFGYYQYYGNYQYKYYADRYLYKKYDYENENES